MCICITLTSKFRSRAQRADGPVPSPHAIPRYHRNVHQIWDNTFHKRRGRGHKASVLGSVRGTARVSAAGLTVPRRECTDHRGTAQPAGHTSRRGAHIGGSPRPRRVPTDGRGRPPGSLRRAIPGRRRAEHTSSPRRREVPRQRATAQPAAVAVRVSVCVCWVCVSGTGRGWGGGCSLAEQSLSGLLETPLARRERRARRVLLEAHVPQLAHLFVKLWHRLRA